MPDAIPLRPGIYESLHTHRLSQRLEATGNVPADFAGVDDAEMSAILARHISESAFRALRAANGTSERLELVNRVLHEMGEDNDVPLPIRHLDLARLTSVGQPPGPGRPMADLSVRPSTPLGDSALLTNARNEPALGNELQREIATADRIDLLCAFVQWHGMRILEDDLKAARERGVEIRVITTTYMGATQRRALDNFAENFGATVKIQYHSRRTRLHAKAWMFHRNSGFDTAYVGSSNLSRSALLDGAEWNVRLSAVSDTTLMAKFAATFETYWNSDSYETYDPSRDADRLDDALLEARGGTRGAGAEIAISGFEIRPWPYQRAILEALQAERELHSRHRNLVVAATGTGKTVIAALDYKSMCEGAQRPRLLFVAHRKEILHQSLRTYREVLGDHGFGELYVDGFRPERWRHVFASVQSLRSYGIRQIPAGAFDVVVIDEFHHSAAPSYRLLLGHLEPRELLGLTATPERGDGTDVREWFDGRTAAELRLWDAIDADILSPFHYFGIADGTDLTNVTWRRGSYETHELEEVYTASDARVRVVLKQVREKIVDPHRMRALGFCVSIAHAKYMAQAFEKAGLHAIALTQETPARERAEAIGRLRRGEIATIFVVDLFNEGVDIPEVDTILMLRPTESSLLFLQQLGRGLRLADGKAVLTVLDFVGHHHANFQLARRYRALLGPRRNRIQKDAENGFPFLPSGCQISLDRQTQDAVLASIRRHLRLRRNELVARLKAEPTDRLTEFLEENGLELRDIVREGRSFTELRRRAGIVDEPERYVERDLARRVRAFTHVDDRERAEAYRLILTGEVQVPSGWLVSERMARYAEMLYFTLFPKGGHTSVVEGLLEARENTAIMDEMSQVVDIAFDAARTLPFRAEGPLGQIPLTVHAHYQREEILLALGHSSLQKPPAHFREGVAFTETPAGPVDAFFITLQKAETDYSPTTMYADYPISPTLFHWESQSTTSVESPTGQRYIRGESTVLLFVRGTKKGEFGTSPYVFLGPARYVSHTGDRPIAITWELKYPMPSQFFMDAAVAS